jgi:hypothetical protein
VSGSIYVQEGATLSAPALTKSGSIDVQQGATLSAPILAEIYFKKGYTILFEFHHKGTFPPGIYLNITEKEREYLTKMKPLISLKRLDMSDWHSSNEWKKQTIEEVESPECGTTHCMAGWIQIWNKDALNDMSAEEAGKSAAPNLACMFHQSTESAELAINTLNPND